MLLLLANQKLYYHSKEIETIVGIATYTLTTNNNKHQHWDPIYVNVSMLNMHAVLYEQFWCLYFV